MISIGVNSYKSHPFAAKYSKNEHAVFLHAEADAILKAKRKLSEAEMKKTTLVLVRVKYDTFGNQSFGYSKPCEGCEKCIQDHGIKTVIYTLECELDKAVYVTEMK